MNIHELDSYNLNDAVKFNDRLNPRLWDANEQLRPEVQAALLKIANDFAEFLGISDIELKDVTISGSNAAYTYTPHSDIDLHLVVDLPRADASEVYRELFDAKKYQYNDQHNITIGGYDVELYVQNANEPHISQGIYSVLNNDWISVPRRRTPDVDDISTRSKYDTLSQHIDQVIASDDYKKLSALTKKIKRLRQAGLEVHGEFGPENLTFKMLRTQGKIKQLYDAMNSAKDRTLSLKEKTTESKHITWGFKKTQLENIDVSAVEAASPAESKSDEEILTDFVDFCVKELKIDSMPVIKLRRDPQWPVIHKTFGRYIDDRKMLEVAFGQRHIMDVLRTVAHELTHTHQHERETVPGNAGETGSPWENEANAQAGVLMRDYGQLHPELFDAGETELGESASGYIPTKKQANDPRFKMALTVDIKPGQLGKEANKLNLKTSKQGIPQVANPNGLFEKLALELNQFKRKGTLAESVEQLDEVRMAPSNLQQWATSPEAQGIRAGFEAELIFRDMTNGDDDDGEYEPDYDADERCRNLDQVIEFFEGGEGYMTSRQLERLREALDEKYYEWYDEQMHKDFREEQEDLIKKVIMDEGDWELDDEIQKQLIMQDVGDDELTAIIQAGEKAPKFNSSKEQILYAEANPLYDKYLDAQKEAEDLLDDLVQDSIKSSDDRYEVALDDFRDNYQIDDDSGFFSDEGLNYMSDIANSFDVEWPYMSNSNSNNGGREWDSLKDSLQDTIDMPVKVSSGYHSAARKEGLWIIEPDSSLRPDDSEDYGLEIVSPPMPLLTALDKLQEVCDWANDSSEGNAYTNDSTGLHMGVSVPYKGGDVDYVKLIMFLGDEYVLQSFGREANTYCASAMGKLKQNVGNSNARYAANVTSAMDLMRGNLIELANREIQKGVGESKYTSVHIQKGYIEFRSAGGDWLAEESADPEKLSSTMLRYARAMQIAADPSAERREYAKKLYKLIAPEGDSELALFSQFAAGELTAEQLKKRWAEKTIGTEKKMNQRWKLYQNVDGRWEPVPGGEWNGYEEDQVKNAVWGKYGREALDSGEYQLVNMGEQSWEVYDVKTGKTLEIVKGKSKGEVADQVYDKYVDQGLGFQVRPYVDPATLTPRAKLAKRITTKKPELPHSADDAQDAVDPQTMLTGQTGGTYILRHREGSTGTGPVLYQFHADSSQDAIEQSRQWAVDQGVERRSVWLDTAPQNTQPADDRQDSADLQANLQNTERGEWEFYRTETGNVIDRVNDASRMQANAVRADIVRRYGHPDASVGMRRVDQSGVQDVETDVAQNFSEPTTYEIWQRNVGNPSALRRFQAATHPEAMAELERFRQSHPETAPHEFALRNLPA